MKFRTEITPKSPDFIIEHSNSIVTFGSCFAENISEYFRYYKFNTLENPFGVLYNPVSIKNALLLLAEKKVFLPDDLIYHQDEYHSFYHHSDFSHHDSTVCLESINSGLENTSSFMRKGDTIIITFGTAYIYKHIDKGIVVSNCHKIPAKDFERRRLSLPEIKKEIETIIELTNRLSPNGKIIFTVSPVRHWKDGAIENQLSKASLLLAISEIIKENANCHYFPSYEIMMDDLRDYRFYNDDLLHPNKIAVDYIWEKFSSSCFSQECLDLLPRIEKIVRAKEHRIRNPHSEQNIKFVKATLRKIEELTKEYPYINWSEEKDYFSNMIR